MLSSILAGSHTGGALWLCVVGSLLWVPSSGCCWVLAALYIQVLEVRAALAPHGGPMGIP